MKVINFALVLFLFLTACNKSPSIKRLQLIKGILLKSEEINYPSGSTLNFYNDSLYLMGDDALDLIVLDTAFEVRRVVKLFEGRSQRIRKAFKADIEAGDFLDLKSGKELLLFGSGTVSPFRDSMFRLNLANEKLSKATLGPLYQKIRDTRIADLNIEAATFVKHQLVLGNRNNLTQKQNYLILPPSNFLFPASAPAKIIPLNPGNSQLGISGLDYYKKKDILFITFSTEATKKSSADGEIGDSALGLIGRFSKKLNSDSLSLDAMVPLSAIDAVFDKKKIESVAVGEREKGGIVVYLTADNDDGKSILYKLKLLF